MQKLKQVSKMPYFEVASMPNRLFNAYFDFRVRGCIYKNHTAPGLYAKNIIARIHNEQINIIVNNSKTQDSLKATAWGIALC